MTDEKTNLCEWPVQSTSDQGTDHSVQADYASSDCIRGCKPSMLNLK